ncbi:MAG TPA: glycosyl hydrolase-related protein [Candidatus Bathyarchaeia archaeon]|nr:glycosyl hydrolase-related protein [Candidatus Bathyarchaeia archaeon]
MKAFYCVGTHWDREWYEPFQEFRMWLVELIDELLDLLDRDPEYVSFHLDGQAVVLEDYLEIRPERRDRLVEMLRQRRLIAGPWYDLPDEWLISGESFVRNLLRGFRVCRQMGVEPMRFAYTPDQFGHIAALPMIMNGFGLRAGICWRGAQNENYPAHFVWVGPDGSRMVTHKIVDKGSYGVFDFLVRTPMKKAGFSDESFKEHFDPYIEGEKNRGTGPIILMLDAIDHQRPDPIMPQFLKQLSERYPDIEFLWESLETYGEELLKHEKEFPERTGELREPARDSKRVGHYLIAHTISARYPIKQRNDQCQAILEKWAEPYALFQKINCGAGVPPANCGAGVPTAASPPASDLPTLSYLDKAWQYLLRNHPHDSICGCSIDQVHRDMRYRFDQCELIADGVVRRAVAALGGASDKPEAAHLVVHNPLPFGRKDVFELAIPFPPDWPSKYIDGLATAEWINRFKIFTQAGQPVPFQLSRIERGIEHKLLREDGRRTTRVGDVYHIAAELELPAAGYTGFKIEQTEDAVRNQGSLMTGVMSASTGELSFTLNANGTGRLSGPSGNSFDGLFVYEDCGDSGDGWTRGQPVNDIVYRSPGTRVTTAIDEDGPLRTVFRVEREFDLPPALDRKTGWRQDRREPLRVVDLLYVEKDSPCLRVKTRVWNTCRDHRLRVLFPTGLNTALESFAETPFAVVNRDIEIPTETACWHERLNPEKAFTTFFGVHDGANGLAVLAPFGLHEYEVLQTPDRSLALTLFRSTSKTIFIPSEPDGQLLGLMEFEYLLYPFSGRFNAPQALRIIAGCQAGIRTHLAEKMPESRSFVQLKTGDTVVTALKPAENGAGGVIRLWNPGQTDVREHILLNCRVISAELCNLNEEPLQKIEIGSDGQIPITVPKRGLATVKFQCASARAFRASARTD